jgi:hypothetical protein
MSDNDHKKVKDSRGLELLNTENLMRSEGGRKVLFNHLQYCRVFVNIFDKDTNQHNYNAGLRAGGLRLEDELKEASPGLYLKMIEENINE